MVAPRLTGVNAPPDSPTAPKAPIRVARLLAQQRHDQNEHHGRAKAAAGGARS
jgi:hypothetical protein